MSALPPNVDSSQPPSMFSVHTRGGFADRKCRIGMRAVRAICRASSNAGRAPATLSTSRIHIAPRLVKRLSSTVRRMLFAIYGDNHPNFPCAVSKFDHQLRMWVLWPLVESIEHLLLLFTWCVLFHLLIPFPN